MRQATRCVTRHRAVRHGRATRRGLAVGAVWLLLVAACSALPTPSPSLTTGQPTAGPTSTVTPPQTPTPRPTAPVAVFPMEASIAELQAAMTAGELTSVQLVQFYLDRIEEFDQQGPMLNAYIHVNYKALEVAAALDAERAASGPRGPLHGIPIVLKDNLGTTDMPTTAGSLAFDGFVPSHDAFQVARLREAGAVLLGKSNLPDFALSWQAVSSISGQTRSPYDPTRDPGGSSSGTAVAVAANLAAAGLGTDTCGSIRLPAGLNALYGLRPSDGVSSRAGVVPFSPTLDAVGPMARSIDDLALLLDATAGRDPADPTTVKLTASFAEAVDADGAAGRRIGVVQIARINESVAESFDAAVVRLRAAGAETVVVTLAPAPDLGDWGFGDGFDAYVAAEPSAPIRSVEELVTFYGEHPAVVEPEHAPGGYDFTASRAERSRYRARLVALMDASDLDAIAYPASTGPAALVGGQGEAYDCATSAFSGLPALVVPGSLTPEGLPLGLELLGRPLGDADLIAIAAGYAAQLGPRPLPLTTPALATP